MAFCPVNLYVKLWAERARENRRFRQNWTRLVGKRCRYCSMFEFFVGCLRHPCAKPQLNCRGSRRYVKNKKSQKNKNEIIGASIIRNDRGVWLSLNNTSSCALCYTGTFFSTLLHRLLHAKHQNVPRSIGRWTTKIPDFEEATGSHHMTTLL